MKLILISPFLKITVTNNQIYLTVYELTPFWYLKNILVRNRRAYLGTPSSFPFSTVTFIRTDVFLRTEIPILYIHVRIFEHVKQHSFMKLKCMKNNLNFSFLCFISQVFWLGPCVGGVVASLVFEVIFITHQKKSRSEMSVDGGNSF